MKALKTMGKVVLAGITAIGILSLILCFYYLLPVHHNNPKRNSDYVWPAHSVWVKLTEGISWGRFDADGFNNPEVIENPDIIVVGSSHMEATNVFYHQTVCSLLTKKLNHKYSVYNLGISGHNFFKACQYLPVNLGMHDIPPKFAIIETSTVQISEKESKEAVNFQVAYKPSFDAGLIGALQKVPFFRLVYYQIETGLFNIFMTGGKQKDNSGDASPISGDVSTEMIEEKAYNELFSYLNNLENQYGTQIIIFYHPKEFLTKEGNISFQSSEALTVFQAYAEKYGIDFIDMTSAFQEMYDKDSLVAHGFITGEIGKGHLNKNGHAAIAEELYKLIAEREREQ